MFKISYTKPDGAIVSYTARLPTAAESTRIVTNVNRNKKLWLPYYATRWVVSSIEAVKEDPLVGPPKVLLINEDKGRVASGIAKPVGFFEVGDDGQVKGIEDFSLVTVSCRAGFDSIYEAFPTPRYVYASSSNKELLISDEVVIEKVAYKIITLKSFSAADFAAYKKELALKLSKALYTNLSTEIKKSMGDAIWK